VKAREKEEVVGVVIRLCWHKVKNIIHKNPWNKPAGIIKYDRHLHTFQATKDECYGMCAFNSSNQGKVHPWFCLWIAFISLLKHAVTKKKLGKGDTWKRLKKDIFIQNLKQKKEGKTKKGHLRQTVIPFILWYDSDTFECKWSLFAFSKTKTQSYVLPDVDSKKRKKTWMKCILCGSFCIILHVPFSCFDCCQ